MWQIFSPLELCKMELENKFYEAEMVEEWK